MNTPIGVPSSDVPADVDLLHMRIERHVSMSFYERLLGMATSNLQHCIDHDVFWSMICFRQSPEPQGGKET